MVATIGGFLTLLFWGVGDYVSGKSGQSISAVLTVVVTQLVGVLVFLPVVLWFGISLGSPAELLILLMSATAATIAFVMFIKAMAIGPMGVAAPVGNAYPLVTLIIGLAFLGFGLSALQIIACLLIVLGVVFLAFDRTTFRLNRVPSLTISYALITLLAWGVAFALFELVFPYYHWYELLFINAVFMMLGSLLWYMVERRCLLRIQELRYGNMPHAWQAGVWITFGAATFFIAIEYAGSVAIPAVLASASPLATTFLAYYLDDEKLNIYKRFGAVVVVAGIILLNV